MMPELNYLAIIVAGLIPSIIGAIYYGPVLGNAWLGSIGKTAEEMKPDNPAIAYGLSMLGSILLAASIKITNELVHKDINDAGELFFGSFHTFGHGALHGVMLCILTVVPVILSLSLFHKMTGKNILLNIVFWIICFAIMGGILDAWN